MGPMRVPCGMVVLEPKSMVEQLSATVLWVSRPSPPDKDRATMVTGS